MTSDFKLGEDMHHADRRVRRTRRMLRDALVALVIEKGYDTVTVEEITERADVGRTTFYLHYQDKDDLLLEVTGQVADQLESQILNLLHIKEVGIEDIAPMIFKLAGENLRMYRIIMSGQCGPKIFKQFQDRLTRLFRRVLKAEMKKSAVRPVIPLDLAATYLWGALQSTLVWWLDNDMPYQVHEMVRLFCQLSKQGTGCMLATAPDASTPDGIPEPIA
jgi:AcrR family transcriptional regulator